MIKATARDSTGQAIVILGLSGENMTRLMADEPILLNLADLGLPPLRVLLLGGRTETDIAQQLTQRYGPLPFTCPRCNRTSHHPQDREYGYCANCHDYTDPNATPPRKRNP